MVNWLLYVLVKIAKKGIFQGELNAIVSTSTLLASSDSGDEINSDVEFESVAAGNSFTSRSHKRALHTRTSAFIPQDIVKQPKLVTLATRLKMTPVQQATYTAALVAEAGGDTTNICASYSTADKSRRQVGKLVAESIVD